MRTEAVSEELIRQVLHVAADAPEPLGRFDIAEAIDPGSDDLQEGTSEHEAFLQHRIVIVAAAARAEMEGLLDCVRPSTGGESDLLRISARGRELLEQTAGGTQIRPVVDGLTLRTGGGFAGHSNRWPMVTWADLAGDAV